MRVVGIGTDAAEIDRVLKLYERFPETFMNRVFTEREREYCLRKKRNFGESLAARWAAKEATLKALGTGWASGISWTDVEVVNRPDGAPQLFLTGGAKKVADELGVVDAKISLTHCKTLAIAFVVLSAND
ncbi:MAG: holo-ACP synthase [Thermoguttaceae bacterium]|nr:holo-ACP synthase [Thermoguttaceae bacterium]